MWKVWGLVEWSHSHPLHVGYWACMSHSTLYIQYNRCFLLSQPLKASFQNPLHMYLYESYFIFFWLHLQIAWPHTSVVVLTAMKLQHTFEGMHLWPVKTLTVRHPGWSVDACSLGLFFFFLDQYYSSMSLTLPPVVSFCDPENAVVNWCFDQDKGSGNRTPNVLWDVKGFSGSRRWM